MLRIPVHSLAFGAIGMIIGIVLGQESLGLHLAGLGCLVGYVIWLRSRIHALQNGKPFHLGSVVDVVVCTFIAVGFGLVGIGGNFLSNGPFVSMVLGTTAVALWLHWHYSRTVKFFPSAGEIGKETVRAVFADDIGIAALHAVVDVGKDAVHKRQRSILSTSTPREP
jgi:hypothetical protein